MDIEVAAEKGINYVTFRPFDNMPQVLINTSKGMQRRQIQSKGERHSLRPNPEWPHISGTGTQALALEQKNPARKEICYGHAPGITWVVESLLLRGCYRHAHARAQISAFVIKQQSYDGRRAAAVGAYALLHVGIRVLGSRELNQQSL